MINIFNPKKLKDLREDMDMKQKEVAAILEINTSTIAAYEKGKAIPPIEKIFKLAQIIQMQ